MSNRITKATWPPNLPRQMEALYCKPHELTKVDKPELDYSMNSLFEFLAHWGITALSLWVASYIFHGVSFSNKQSLFISALLLGLANAIIRPVVILLTIPLTIVTFGFFLLVINALMMLLVSSTVPGFKVSGFWTAFFASIFIAALSFIFGYLIFQTGDNPIIIPTNQQHLIFT